MNVTTLDLTRIRKWGQYTKLYFHKKIIASPGIGVESDAVEVITADSLKLHTDLNCDVYESLATREEIEADTALWIQISDATSAVFSLSPGASFIKIANKSATLEAVMNVTGI